jgi:glycosyltransferase involved in cell wall biosynthesis
MGRILYDTSFAGVSLLSSSSLGTHDVIVTVSPPVQLALIGALLAKVWSSHHLVVVQDLPVEAGRAVGMLKSGSMIRFGRALERITYRSADGLVVLNERFRGYLLELGVEDSRVQVIPNWADLAEYSPDKRDIGERQRLGLREADFLLIHTGNMGEKQGLSQIVAGLTNSDWFRLTLVGDGSQRPLIKAAAELAGFRSLGFLPLQPKETFVRLLAASDAALLAQKPGVVDGVAPSKLLAYMAAARPVIAAVNPDSVAADLVEQSGWGIRVAPGDGQAVIDAADRLRRNRRLGTTLGAAGRAFAQRNFDRAAVLSRYDEVLAELA